MLVTFEGSKTTTKPNNWRMISLLTIINLVFASSEHPFLYYPSEDVEDLQLKARTSHQHIFSRLREAAYEMKRNPHIYTPPENWNDFSSSWNEIYGNSLASLAFYCVLEVTDVDALALAKTIVTRFTKLTNWRCALNLEDDVPVAHSLVAVATAYDFLWDKLDERQRRLTADKITEETRGLYERSFQMWWGRTYIQNHVATNYVALLTGALVMGNRTNETYLWRQKAHQMLNTTMFLLSFVKDGTLGEGVSYGSYTSRSITQYITLAKRHLNADLTNNEWLQNHFWFLYRTILPTFDEALGIADSNGKWFYGPESQLVFLDSMVLKNGFGNWLAKEVQRAREDGKTVHLAKAHQFATLYTEFLFYDENIGEKPPIMSDAPTLHIFDDWGVAVYGRGAGRSRGHYLDRYGNDDNLLHKPAVHQVSENEGDKGTVRIPYSSSTEINKFEFSKGNLTFLSFKCGVLHGKAINKIVNTKPWSWITGQTQFNPGHEHPDHASFTFYPNGIPFITEALYGPKYTWLNNALSFGSSSANHALFIGQLGESHKWLKFNSDKYWKAKGTLLAAAQENERVFIAGEYSEWYEKSLGLEGVYRMLLLIRFDVLLVCDVIVKKSSSPLNKMSAFFHNRFSPFSIREEEDGEVFAEVIQQGTHNRVYWVSSAGKTIDVQSQRAEFKAESGKRKTNFVNITTPIKGVSTTVAYIFSGGNPQVRQLKLSHNLNGTITVALKIKDLFYSINIPSTPKESNLLLRTSFRDYVEIRVEERVTILDRNISSWRRKVLFLSFLLIIVCLWRSFKVKRMKLTRKVLRVILQYLV